jgi:branched-chain amino acid transport system substrate-binding protein
VPRARFVTPAILSRAMLDLVGSDRDRRRRFFGLTTVSTTTTNARYVQHYNETFGDRITRTESPNSSYDAFYLLAYASYALAPDEPPTGANLARAIARLVPPGTPVDVGPSHIFEGFSALRAGKHVDLNGATGKLDFDLSTGDAPVDHAILCPNVDERGRAFDSIESGLVYEAATKKLVGALRCPDS